jgi:hypothetical protein
MKKHADLSLLFFGLMIYSLNTLAENQCVCTLDAPQINQLPKNYRSTKLITAKRISTIGLSTLNESGSAQFSAAQLPPLIQAIGHYQTIVDVDLRQESHGFLNGHAISCRSTNNWGNLGKTPQQIKMSEDRFLASVVGGSVKSVFNEEQLARANGIAYQRIYVTDRCRPTDAQVDEFIHFTQTLKPHTWLHFHCRAGKGRTTTFMIMYDMMHNAKRVSFNAILERQAALGGANLKKLSPSQKFYLNASLRLVFLHHFYRYCRENQDHFSTTWTQWLLTQ